MVFLREKHNLAIVVRTCITKGECDYVTLFQGRGSHDFHAVLPAGHVRYGAHRVRAVGCVRSLSRLHGRVQLCRVQRNRLQRNDQRRDQSEERHREGHQGDSVRPQCEWNPSSCGGRWKIVCSYFALSINVTPRLVSTTKAEP